jgi:hypothetical protein
MNRARIYLATIAFAVLPFETILLAVLIIIKHYYNVRSAQHHFNIWVLQANVPGGYFIFRFCRSSGKAAPLNKQMKINPTY